MATRKSAVQLLGVTSEKKLRFWDRLNVKVIERAMDEGATFRTSEDAQRYARHQRRMAAWYAIAIFAACMLLGTTYYIDGYRTGIQVMEQVCKLIIIGG